MICTELICAGSIPTLAGALALSLIGFCVGVAGSFFGVGGAFMVTPALNILGFPMVWAIGTDLAHMTGKSIVATLRHRRLGHVDWKAGGLLLLGTLPGVKLGASTVMKLEHIHATESVLRIAYIVILTIVGVVIMRESFRSKGDGELDGSKALLRRRFLIKPLVTLKVSGIEGVSLWGIVLLGLATGFLAAFLGVGGGFVRMPALLYLLGMPTRIAVGTDLLEVLFSGGYGAFLYAREGRVDVFAALVMLIGASVGSQLGAQATRCVEPGQIRRYLGVMVLGSAAAVVAKQMGFKMLSAGMVLTLGPALAGIILYKLVIGLREQRKVAAKAAEVEAVR